MNQSINQLLIKLDNSKEQTNELEILSKIKLATKQDESLEARSERIAFSFREYRTFDQTPYFGPMYYSTINDGQIYQYPNISHISEEMINYWQLRVESSNNFLMKARYSGLLWDFAEKITGNKPSDELVIIYIKSLIEVCERDLCIYNTESIQKITRAYYLSCSVNKRQFAKKCIRVAIELEDRIAKNDHPGLLGFCFDLFVIGEEKLLTTSQKEKLISEIEARFLRISQSGDHWNCEDTGIQLAKYYRLKKQNERVRRVIEIVGQKWSDFCETVDVMSASSYYQRVQRIYLSFGLNDKAENLSKKIAEFGSDVSDWLDE